MGAYKFALKMLKLDKKLTLVYLLSISFPIAIIFNLLNVMNNKSFFYIYQAGRVDIAAGLVFFLAILVCIFTFYANMYFITSKSKEMAIEELGGVWPGKLARMILFTNAIIEVIGCVIGILFGILLVPVFLKTMYIAMGKTGNIFAISPDGIWGTLWVLILQLGYVSLGDYGYVSTREIIDLIEANKKSRPKDLRFLHINSKVYLVIYLIPLIFLFIATKPEQVETIGNFNIVITLLGVPGLLQFYIPETILNLKKKKYLNDKIKLISLSNVYASLKQLKFLIITLAVSVEAILCIMAMYPNDIRVRAVCIISYVITVVMIAVSIVYKIVLDSNNRRHGFMELKLVGYTRKQLENAAKHELKIFYSITIGVPLFHILIFLFLFRRSNIISTGLVIMMLSVFLAVFLITIVLSFIVYKKFVFKEETYRIL